MINKEFDRSIAFTFYKEWKEDADNIEEDFGADGKARFYDAIIDYALFEIEPEMKPPIKYFWSTIKEKIDASQEHRSRGFSKEDTEVTQKIIDYKNEHPEASQRDISNAVGCSLGKVNKVLRDINSTSNNTITNTITSTTTSTTVNVNMNTDDYEENIREDVKIKVINLFKKKSNYKHIQEKVEEIFNINISFDSIKSIIDEYLSDNNVLEQWKYKIELEEKEKQKQENLVEQKSKIGIVIEELSTRLKDIPSEEEIWDFFVERGYTYMNTLKDDLKFGYYKESWDEIKESIKDYYNSQYDYLYCEPPKYKSQPEKKSGLVTLFDEDDNEL